MLAVEDLAAFATGYAPTLSRAQYAALLQAIDHRLELAGRSPLRRGGARYWEVRAAYTSTTCPECGAVDKASRPERDKFKCTACGHEGHADVNAARNIARKGRETRGKYEIVKSRKAPRDGGGGPSSGEGEGVVSAPVSADTATRGISGANSPSDGNNAGEIHFPPRARSAASSFFATGHRENIPPAQSVIADRVRPVVICGLTETPSGIAGPPHPGAASGDVRRGVD